MRNLLIIALVVIAFNARAGIIEFTCHESYTQELFQKFDDEGFGQEDLILEGSIGFVRTADQDGDWIDFYVSGESISFDSFEVGKDSILYTIEKLDVMAPAISDESVLPTPKRYVFSNSGNYEFDGSLEIFNISDESDPVLEKESLCVVSQD
jgi:hypothetical protein